MTNRSIVLLFVAVNGLGFAGYRAFASPREVEAPLEASSSSSSSSSSSTAAAAPAGKTIEPIVVDEAPLPAIAVIAAPTEDPEVKAEVDPEVKPAREAPPTRPARKREREREREQVRDREPPPRAPEVAAPASPREEVSAPPTPVVAPKPKPIDKKRALLEDMESNPYKRAN